MSEIIEKLKAKHDSIQNTEHPNMITIRDGIEIKIHPESRFPFEFFSFRSPEMVKEMDMFVKYAKGRKCFLDIGAHHGLFSLVFNKLNPEGKVYAFEPSPEPFGYLEHNIHGIGNIWAEEVALSDINGLLLMHKEWDHLVRWDGKGENKTDLITCIDADRFCAINFINNVDTIKIDCEGDELKIMKGLSSIIKTLQPMIFLEIHPERMAKQGDSMEDLVLFIMKYYNTILRCEDNMALSYDEIRRFDSAEHRIVLLPDFSNYIPNKA